jgi:hypothetical protein
LPPDYKNGAHIDGLAALGFGFLEVGTVTPRPQPGNPSPRLFRLAQHGALINRLGFNNGGVPGLLANLARRRWRGILGINIGKNADTPLERARRRLPRRTPVGLPARGLSPSTSVLPTPAGCASCNTATNWTPCSAPCATARPCSPMPTAATCRCWSRSRPTSTTPRSTTSPAACWRAASTA